MTVSIIGINNTTTVRGLVNFNLESILECGQCFRWECNGYNDYSGIVGNKVVRVIQERNSAVFHGCTELDFSETWHEYFDMGTNYGDIIEKLSIDDIVMQTAAGFAPGIRILRQPLFETLISFIISANNSIPNIRRIISTLSTMYGKSIDFEGRRFYTFPEPAVLAEANVKDLILSKAGYRSEYIKKTAAAFKNSPMTVSDLKSMGYLNAKKTLECFTGVGSKVADCTLLFSGAYVSAFPVDIWVKKIMEEFYIKEETSLKRIGQFADSYFGSLAGYAQQYLFYYARSNM